MCVRFRQIVLFLLVVMAPGRLSFAEELVVPGAGNPEYVLGRLAEAFNQEQSQHNVIIPTSTGTAGALRDIRQGIASLARVGRPLRDDERDQGIVFIPLGRDPVVFVAGAAVTTAAITSAQVMSVYQGQISDWSELGGAPGPIRAIGREITDASRMVIVRHIKAFEGIVFGENVKVVHLDPQMVALLDRFPTSLGFLNRSALFACKTKVIPLALDGVAATPETLASGRYPMAIEFGLIHRSGNITPAARAFVAFIQSPAGARILREHGVTPITARS